MHSQPTGGSLGSDKPKREAILDLSKYVDDRIRVKFTGGREGIVKTVFIIFPKKISYPVETPVTGILKGYDQLLNLVLDDVTEDIQCKILHIFQSIMSFVNIQCPNLAHGISVWSFFGDLRLPSLTQSMASKRSPTPLDLKSERKSPHFSHPGQNLIMNGT